MRVFLNFVTAALLFLFSQGVQMGFAQPVSCPIPSHLGNWSLRQPIPLMNSEFGAASLNGLIYAAGGYNMENHAKLLIYDPKKNTWTEGPDLPHGTHHSAVIGLNQKLYVMGGSIAPEAVQIYDPVARTWSSGRPIPTPRAAMAGAVIDGKIHLIGGARDTQTGTAVNNHEVYDPQTNSWQSRAPLPNPSEHVAAGVLNGRIYVVGGRQRFTNMALTQVYNPTTNTWSSAASLNQARSGLGLVTFEKAIYVFGGEDLRGRKVVGSTERYDANANRWDLINPMLKAVHGSPGVVSGRHIYVFGGGQGAGSGIGTNFVQRLDISNSPKQPLNLTAQAVSSSSVQLRWVDSSTNEVSYLVQSKIGTKPFQTIATITANSKQYVARGLTPATLYTFRIIARNGCADSTPSVIATATTRQ